MCAENGHLLRARYTYEQIYYSSLMPRTYLCARLLETLD